MTPIESIYEIKSDVEDLQKYLKDKSPVVSHKAQERYEKLVNRFFKENKDFVKTEYRQRCLSDLVFFLKLMDTTLENYYEMGE